MLVKGTFWHWKDKKAPLKNVLKLFSIDGLPDEYCRLQMEQFCHEKGFDEPYLSRKASGYADDGESK